MIMWKLKYYIFILAVIFTPAIQQGTQSPSVSNDEGHHEELYVHPLPSGHVSTFFQFTTRWRYEEQKLYNTQLIPRSIADILMLYDVKELHISLTQGFWRYEDWGYPVVDSAPGAEAWAWFAGKNLTSADVNEQWTRLASTFSGILCASLNFIDKTNSVEPKYGFRPQFVYKKSNNIKQFVRYATLPREIVCTENLTPWKKLLPCNSKYGFASLLNSGHVYNTNYHSIGIKVRTICQPDETDCILELTETANFVYDPKLLGSNDFSLRRLFGQGLNGYCALAKSSKIYVNLVGNQNYELTPPPMYNVTSVRGGSATRFGVYDIQKSQKDNKLFNIAWINRQGQSGITIVPPPPLFAHRFIVGHGPEKGQIITKVRNNLFSTLPIVIQENIPWFVPSYMHTLQLKVIASEQEQQKEEIIPKMVHYIPGEQRERPYHLEIAFELPARSTVQISFDFDYIFLKLPEYPPDANHGHYLGSAVISTQLPFARNYSAIPLEGYLFADSFNATRHAYFIQLRTESLILSLPTPDFSMPYNVICLACTVVALAFGPIHSVATKRMVIERKDAPPQSITGKIFHKLFGRKGKAANDTPILDERLDEEVLPPSDDFPDTLIDEPAIATTKLE